MVRTTYIRRDVPRQPQYFGTLCRGQNVLQNLSGYTAIYVYIYTHTHTHTYTHTHTHTHTPHTHTHTHTHTNTQSCVA